MTSLSTPVNKHYVGTHDEHDEMMDPRVAITTRPLDPRVAITTRPLDPRVAITTRPLDPRVAITTI